MIPFNHPPYIGTEESYVLQAIQSESISGDGHFTFVCQQWFEETLPAHRTLLTPSCTHALEMAALLIDIEGDEVIMPSYTFVSTANAFVLRGAKIVFVDIRPDTLNIDETLIENAITPRTKAIVPVHYAGVGCEMDSIMDIASKHNLFVIEDAAQGMMSTYKGKALGTIGHMGCYSFHETKNYTSGGEGGLLIINDERFIQRAEIIREKGTNRSQFFRGQVDKYSWVDIGSSYLPSELQAAYLFAQLKNVHTINDKRLSLWNSYYTTLKPLEEQGLVSLPHVPPACQHNGHIFYLKTPNLDTRTRLLSYFKSHDILAVFHYVPLHTSQAGQRFGRFSGEDNYTTSLSEQLVRLPMFYALTTHQQEKIIETLYRFYQ